MLLAHVMERSEEDTASAARPTLRSAVNHDDNRRRKGLHPFDIHVGSRVRERRLRLAMSQGELGGLLTVSFQQIQKYENGRNRISAGLLPRIAQILGVKITSFYEGMEPDRQGAEARPPEEGDAQLVMRFVSSLEGAQFIRDVMKIKDTKIRRRVLALMKSLV
jgi:transcriptional regulator with XRE-family HTH domain